MRLSWLALLLVGCTRHAAPPATPAVDVVPDPQAHGAHDGHGDHPKGDGATTHHRFEDAARWSEVFDDPERAAWQQPEVVVRALKLSPGDTVADIGAGTGYLNAHLAAAVGPTGRVIAIDVEPNLVAFMQERATREDTPQVQARLGAYADPGLQPGEADRILLVDTYHHIDSRTAYFHALRPTLRPGGRLVVVDFKPGDLPVGPKGDHKLPLDKVQAELQAAGWRFLAAPDLLPYQYVAIFEPMPDAAPPGK